MWQVTVDASLLGETAHKGDAVVPLPEMRAPHVVGQACESDGVLLAGDQFKPFGHSIGHGLRCFGMPSPAVIDKGLQGAHAETIAQNAGA